MAVQKLGEAESCYAVRAMGFNVPKGTVGNASAVEPSHAAQEAILRREAKDALGASPVLFVAVVDFDLKRGPAEVLHELPSADQAGKDDIHVLEVNVTAVLVAFSSVHLHVVEFILAVHRQTIFLRE